MQGISCNGQDGWWIATGVGNTLLLLGVAVYCRWRQRTHDARARTLCAAHETAARVLEESMLQSCQGLILRLDAVARTFPLDHPARHDLVAVIARAEQVLEKGLHRAQHRRDAGTPPGANA